MFAVAPYAVLAAAIKSTQVRGEPLPLRLAPLHMDVHAGNPVHSRDGLRLIDWEYAGDGDIAMELAAVWTGSEHQRRELVAEYARCAMLDETQLWRRRSLASVDSNVDGGLV